jgi:hypothetical protein
MERPTAREIDLTPPEDARMEIPEAPRSGVRLKSFSVPLDRLRQLARRAESVGLDPIAFELLLAAAHVESGKQIEVVRSELLETADFVPEREARFYREAVRSLGVKPTVD